MGAVIVVSVLCLVSFYFLPCGIAFFLFHSERFCIEDVFHIDYDFRTFFYMKSPYTSLCFLLKRMFLNIEFYF